RYEIALENYCKVIHIEALTALNMLKTDILPAVSAYGKEVADVLYSKESYKMSAKYENALLKKLTKGTDALYDATIVLDEAVSKVESMTDYSEISFFCKDVLIPAMEKARSIADSLETVVPTEKWPYPSYGDILFSVK
ncbi:MAG: glutamine synthetase type III, partial [Clostridia bacterium]|nr:glutamine synthetase type III [Clostridia bacterium]